MFKDKVRLIAFTIIFPMATFVIFKNVYIPFYEAIMAGNSYNYWRLSSETLLYLCAIINMPKFFAEQWRIR